MGKLIFSGKRFFGQILIDHWMLRVNGEQHTLPFGKQRLTLELPAGTYPIIAYTPYLGMRCMQVRTEVRVLPGSTTLVSYRTVFDIFKNGILEYDVTV